MSTQDDLYGVSIVLNLSRIASEVNAGVGRDVETTESVRAWVRDNMPDIPGLLTDVICDRIDEAHQ